MPVDFLITAGREAFTAVFAACPDELIHTDFMALDVDAVEAGTVYSHPLE
jgi:hypothetical protein